MANQHGYCPKCKCDLDGGDIVETFIAKGNTPERAMEIAENYAYRPGHTQWGRQIGLYDSYADRTTHWQCPDCGHVWDRELIMNKDGKFEEKRNGN